MFLTSERSSSQDPSHTNVAAARSSIVLISTFLFKPLITAVQINFFSKQVPS